ncbi:MAG: transposase [Gammaproteobacteria bacterium HGW-Gammaproteobacteria-2]|nr:MAG: transposase [Gammaproteobacteria bacterium HGW-Gammaproteobacteria-2]
MPRPPRYELVGVPQHVIQRGNNRQTTFFADEDYRAYLGWLGEAAERHGCSIHAYVLMTNHVHLLLTPQVAGAIGKVMQSLGRRYVQYINAAYGRSGTLWEGRYKASLIDSERYLLTCYRYIELNPVRAGMVSEPGKYRWSSYSWHGHGRVDPLISDHGEYWALGRDASTRQAAYRDLFRDALDPQALDDLRTALNQCRLCGSERFKDEIEVALQRRVRPGKAGRPRKTDDSEISV